ncbi:MAG TPA: RNA methyltransferase [Ferruginibacter sp.]|nr:RNA methyltransferase [Ferruginibacter sp.]
MFSKSTIKYIQSLQHKKFRDEHNCFVAEGPKVVQELLTTGDFNCKSLYALQSWVDAMDQELQQYLSGRIWVVKDFELEKMASFATANQVLAVFERKESIAPVSVKNELTLALDDIRDPGNLGTIIRTADWFGIKNLICSNNTVDQYNPKVVQSTMASLGRVNLYYTDLATWLPAQKPVPVFATALEGKSLHSFSGTREAIVVIGNESKGISAEILQMANGLINIPRYGQAESLNAAVAAAIVLYALRS